MTVLRSREIITTSSSIKSQQSTSPKTLNKGFNFQPPMTPVQALEPSNRTPSPSCDSAQTPPDQLGLGFDSLSGNSRRRSLRLKSRASSEEITENGLGSSGKRKTSAADNHINVEKEGVCGTATTTTTTTESNGFDLGVKRVRVSDRLPSKVSVSGELGTGKESEEKGRVEDELVAKFVDILLQRDECDSQSPSDLASLSAMKGKGKRKFEVDTEFSAAKSAGEGERDKGCMNLRSGKEIPKVTVEGVSSRLLGVESGKHDNFIDAAHSLGSFEPKETQNSPRNDEHGSGKGTRIFSKEEKGKGEMVEDDLLSNRIDAVDLDVKPSIEKSTEDTASGAAHLEGNVALQNEEQVLETNARANTARRFRDIARRNASKYAHFSSQVEEENSAVDDGEREVQPRESDIEMEDWPGPFSTAMRIIRDRKTSVDVQQENSSLGKSDPVQVIWVPRIDQQFNATGLLVPSLLDLCTSILIKNANAITSLDGVPDILRHKLCHLLCDSRRMNSHFLDLLVRGSPTEIRIRDCSWLTEEQFTTAFQGCEFSNLMVLQLDQCGRCLPDYTLFPTLARSSHNLPALTTISVKGACRLSDGGLRALVSSAPRLRSVNLSQCSLVTSCGITHLADALGSVLRELYIDDCQSLDAILILSALTKLENLEVLSLSGIQSVCDDFVTQFVAVRGHHLKELNLTDCTKLTDSSMKVIAEYCTGLRSIDLSYLCKLTDSAIGYLANGCQAIQTLKLCRNAFSDEAIAAYLETCGGPLKELSLNNVNKVGYNTAISLAKRSSNLASLDLSWCRNLTNEALGLIVDSCLSLEVLKLFGCTQITNVFVNGHSNPKVKVIGLKMSPILEHIKVPELQVPLHYSSVPSST